MPPNIYYIFSMKKISNWANHFLTAIAAISALTSLITWLFNIKMPETYTSWIYLGCIFTICIWYSHLQCKRKNRISLKFSPKLEVNIAKGDLFDNNHHGIIVIPVNEYFDTIVDDCIISSRTIHGQFINRYFNHNVSDLDNIISKSLKEQRFKSNPQRKRGKVKKYPLGTCANVPYGKDIYVLAALTHFDENNNTNISPSEFKDVLYSLFQHLEKTANMRPVYMPLIGSGQSRFPKSPQRILFSILECLELMPLSLPAGINIIIHQQTSKNINLRLIENFCNEILINSH